MDEFSLIDAAVAALGDRAAGPWIALGPGDDAAVIDQRPDHQSVASTDTLLGDVHFPASAPAARIGYRALMVSLSDLAAMAAEPRYVLVALTLPDGDAAWVSGMAAGMAAAARDCDTYVCGGNFARGPLSITVTVVGDVPSGGAVTRAGAQAGDAICVSGALGAAAACVRQGYFRETDPGAELRERYYSPRARFDCVQALRGNASSAIDVSDGLLQDLSHVLAASGVGAELNSASIPVADGADIGDALHGGDDYEVLCTAATPPLGFIPIGNITAEAGLVLDDKAVQADGYQHFA